MKGVIKEAFEQIFTYGPERPPLGLLQQALKKVSPIINSLDP